MYVLIFGFKVALLFPINLLSKHILRNKHTYIVLNASYQGFCFEFERKKKQH